MSYYNKFKVGDLVWVLGDELNGYRSGYGLVVERRIVMLEDAYMLDIFVLHDGVTYRPLNISRLGVINHEE